MISTINAVFHEEVNTSGTDHPVFVSNVHLLFALVIDSGFLKLKLKCSLINQFLITITQMLVYFQGTSDYSGGKFFDFHFTAVCKRQPQNPTLPYPPPIKAGQIMPPCPKALNQDGNPRIQI